MATSPSAVSNLPAGYTLEQSSAPQPQQGEVPGLPAGYQLEKADSQQAPDNNKNLVDKWVANPSTVPNARIRNLPNPAEGMTPIQALTNGVKTGAELAAIPASLGGGSASTVGQVVDAAGTPIKESALELIPSVVDKAKAVVEWAKANPIKAVAIQQIANEMGIHPFDLMHSAIKYGKNLFADESEK